MSTATVSIPLRARDGSIRAYSLIDAVDADAVNRWRWSLSAGYAVRRATTAPGEHHMLGLHRELLGLTYGDPLTVDHINHDRLDNRRANLRVISKAGNNQNVLGLSSGTSAFRGVSWVERLGKWRAYVQRDGKYIHLGMFTDEREAALVAQAARLDSMPFTVEQEIAV